MEYAHRLVHSFVYSSLRWRHDGHDGVSNHQPHNCLLNRLFRRRSKKTWKLRVTGLCKGNSLGTGEFPAQMASYAENVSIWWRHHDMIHLPIFFSVASLNMGRSYDRTCFSEFMRWPVPLGFLINKFPLWDGAGLWPIKVSQACPTG